ncbi:MAG: ANTAR domain-containing protein [Nocardioides sp.]|uniref:ANTAR domain-containing protein n=1 Tax=Nocardioides sp. TaxID=35761 RepID=UPI003262FF22
MTNSSDLVAVMAELHAALAPGDLAQTLRRVTEAAVELLPDVDGATITIEHADGHHETAAAAGSEDDRHEPARGAGEAAPELTADTAARLDRLQQELGEGPAVDVIDSSESEDPVARSEADDTLEPGQAPAVTASDLARDDRYPAYAAVAASAGVSAQVAVVLFDTARARGVLNLYSLRSHAFDDMAVLTDLFAHHSATALAYAVDYHDRDSNVAERRAVGQALGIVMERFTFSEAKALALMQRTAEQRAVSVRLVAQELVALTEGASLEE